MARRIVITPRPTEPRHVDDSALTPREEMVLRMRFGNFSCANCHRICEWVTRKPTDSTEYKTVGSRYCNARECVDAEERAHGIPISRIRGLASE